jgi:hypothetical protein
MVEDPGRGDRLGLCGCAGLGVEQKADRGGPVGDPELAHRLLDVAIHRLGRDLELAADLLGGPMSRGQLQALALARRQSIE